MPAVFSGFGISFQYPENWTLDDSDARLGRHSVTVYSPGGAFWSVAVQSGGADPAKLAAAAVETMKKEYAWLEAEEAEETIANYDLTGYDVAFYYLDLTSTAVIRSARIGGATYTIFAEGEDREFVAYRQVFQAMTVSLLSYLRAAEDDA
jgi:hypothetical protein